MARQLPPRRKTEEASGEGLRLAKEAGNAYRRMVEYFIENIAEDGAKQRAGDFLVGVAVEEAEPLWHPEGGDLALKDPPKEANAHLEVVVMDGADGRFIPQLDVTVTLRNEEGEAGTWDLPFLWHPTMFHYGRNVSVPKKGAYTVVVGIERPSFPRHDRVNGKRYENPVRVEFRDIEL